MWQKYDIESDQLKCNFCTQWFKTTLHFANLQRYSLKACPKCLNNFKYTILHPDTYRIHQVMLVDSNITITRPQSTSGNESTEVSLQLESVEQDIKDRLSQMCQLNIKKAIQDMEKASKRLEGSLAKIKQDIQEKSIKQLQELRTYKNIDEQINSIKTYPLNYWLKDSIPPKANQPSKLARNASGYLCSSRKTVCQMKEKQNISTNRQPFCKSIKNKIKGLQDPTTKLSSHCLELPPSARSRPKSLSKSSTQSKSSRRLDSSFMISSVGSREERDINEIIKLLETEEDLKSYLPFEVNQDQNNIVKHQSKRTQADAILDLRETTLKGGELLQIIGTNLNKLNFQIFLKSLGHQPAAKTIRIIKSNLSDHDFNNLLNFLTQHPNIQTVIVTNNRLTELSVQALKNFLFENRNSQLRYVYFGSNRIHRDKVIEICRGLAVSVYL